MHKSRQNSVSFLIFFLFFFGLSQVVKAQAVIGYSQDAFEGKSLKLHPGRYDAHFLVSKGLAQKINSLKIPQGLQVWIYSRDYWQGKSRVLKTHVSNLGWDWEDTMVSLEIIAEARVELFAKTNYKKPLLSLSPGSYSLDSLLAHIKGPFYSWKIPQGLEIIALSNVGNGDITDTIRANKAKLDPVCYADIHTLMVAEQEVQLFEHRNFEGRSLQLLPGAYDVLELRSRELDDQISSIKIPDGYLVIAFEQAHFQGKSKVFTQDMAFTGWELNDAISSLMIRKRIP